MTHRFRFYSASFSTHTKKLQTCPVRADGNSRDRGQERYRFVSGLWDQFHYLDSWPQFSYFYTLSPVFRFLSLVHLNPSPGVRFLLGVVWQRQLFCPPHPPKLLLLLLWVLHVGPLPDKLCFCAHAYALRYSWLPAAVLSLISATEHHLSDGF